MTITKNYFWYFISIDDNMYVLMAHLFSPIIGNIEFIVEHGGYSILFLITILEGIPFIGPFIPGHTTVILSGFLIKIGIFSWLPVFVLVIVGAMIGDAIGYILGRKYGFIFLEKFGKYIFIKPEHIEKTKKIVEKHTGKAIIFGRFSPITRPLAPFVVGASGVHIKRFWFFDFIGVSIWAIGSIVLGYIFGASYHAVVPILGKFIVIAIVLSILIVWGYRFINKQFKVFAKYELFVLFFNLLGLYTFFKTVQDALVDKVFLLNLDIWMNSFFYSLAIKFGPSGLTLMNIITDILSPTFLSIVSLIGIVYFLIKKNWRYATISFLSVGGGLVIGAFIKEIVGRVRPLGAFIIENDFSFPSGHAVMATVFFTLLIYIFARKIKVMLWREIFISISVLSVILALVSRLYLGVHWFSDVIAGMAFGLFWTTLVILLIRYAGMIWEIFKKWRSEVIE
jgi:undecaprenyl-diphosphatase